MLAVPLTPIAASWSYLVCVGERRDGERRGEKGREGGRREDTEQ
jgi:hypothetical protein